MAMRRPSSAPREDAPGTPGETRARPGSPSVVPDGAAAYDRRREHGRGRAARAEALERRYRELQLVYRMADAVSRAGALDEICEVALDGLHEALACDRAAVLLSDDAGVMRFKAWRRLTDGYRAAVEGHSPWPPDDGDPQPIIVPDVTLDAELAPLLPAILSEGIRALAFVPLVCDGRLLGKLMVYFDTPSPLGADELRLARTLASHIAVAIARRRDEEVTRRLFHQAQAASRAKSDFLATMSHELRTPLNAIAGYVEILGMELHGPVTPQQREDLRRIRVNQRHLLGLIDDILTVAKLEGGHVELRVEHVALADALADAYALVEPQIAARGLLYVEYAPRGEDVRCRADRDKLMRIVLNLLANAVKYTDPGGRVTLAWDAVPGMARVRVHDTGRGIPADKHEAVFEPFVQLTDTLATRADGTGLGLAISRGLARAMGGDLTVESEVGVGSTFTLTLPRVE
jgi:signal transduction histidine kinase